MCNVGGISSRGLLGDLSAWLIQYEREINKQAVRGLREPGIYPRQRNWKI